MPTIIKESKNMAYESRFDRTEGIMYLRFWDNMTADEFHAALVGEREFFDGMTGTVGVIVEVIGLKSIPPAILTHARNTYFARYKNIVIALVGASGFVTALGQMFNKLTAITVRNFADFAEAEAFVKQQIAQRSTR
jgi:hypothetical protein